MMLKDVERNLVNRIERIKYNFIVDPSTLKWALDQTLADLRKHMYAEENPESAAHSQGLCPKCGQRLPRPVEVQKE